VLLADAASLFTNVWLFDTLPKAMGLIAPMVYNSDGDELVFHSVRFPLATGVTQKAIGAQLDTVKALHRESATFWNWLGTKPTKRKDKKADGVAFNSTMEDGTPILGNIELKGRFVTLTVNSAERAKAGTPLFTKALGNLVRAPLTASRHAWGYHPARSLKVGERALPNHRFQGSEAQGRVTSLGVV
jgi:hypothetical protein